jgi:hypothetical protein
MKLVNAARYFDKDSVLDAYTSAFLFKGQMLSPAEHVSGDTFRRHTLSAQDGLTSPARHAVSILGDVWLLGDSNPDGFKGAVIRRNYSLKRSTGLIKLLTPAQACLSSAGTSMHAYKEYYRDNLNPVTDAEFDTMWNIYCPPNEAVIKGSFFLDGAMLLRVRNSYRSVEGFNIAETDQFDSDALQAATFTSNAGISLTTDLPSTVSVATTVIQTDQAKFYKFRTAAEADRKPGDRTVFVAKSALTPKVGAVFTMLGGPWKTLSVVDEADSWALSARLA